MINLILHYKYISIFSYIEGFNDDLNNNIIALGVGSVI